VVSAGEAERKVPVQPNVTATASRPDLRSGTRDVPAGPQRGPCVGPRNVSDQPVDEATQLIVCTDHLCGAVGIDGHPTGVRIRLVEEDEAVQARATADDGLPMWT